MGVMDYSIIIPHKNSTTLLEKLIKSCLVVNNCKIQIIVVDDNSKEEEKHALNVLKDKYSFQLFNNDGIGAGAARNTGMKYIKGKWTIFADADDFFCTDFKNICSKYINSDSDIIYFNVTSCYSDTLRQAYRDTHIKTLLKKFNLKKDEGYLRCCYTVPWGKMFNSNFLLKEDIKFEEILAGNDMVFSIISGIKAKKITADMTEIYCNTVSSGSITTTLSKDRFESRFQATLRANNILRKENYSKFQISILYFLFKSSQFGLKYFFHVCTDCIKNKSNPLIGLRKLLNYKNVIRDRQNPQFINKNK